MIQAGTLPDRRGTPSPGDRVRAAIAGPARIVLSATLRALPFAFGQRGRSHADWRANNWAPKWLHEGVSSVRARRLGIRWDLDLRDNVQRSIYYTGRYESTLQSLLASASPAGAVVVDAGAHIGVHALPLARSVSQSGGRVIAFEPAPDNAEKLRSTAARSGVSNLLLVETALGSTDGTITLYASEAYGAHDTGVRSQFGTGASMFTVSVATFDSWAEEHDLARLDVVKVDVEGAELRVLIGMSRSLQQFRPILVAVEIIEENCLNAGIVPADIREFFTELKYAELPGLVEKNAIFVPEETYGS